MHPAILSSILSGGGTAADPNAWDFEDDFNRADSTDLGANWSEVEGTSWAIASNRATAAVADAQLKCLYELASPNMEAQMTYAAGSVAPGIILRAPTVWAETYYMARWYSSTSDWEIYRRTAGAFTLLGNFDEGLRTAPLTIRFRAVTVGATVELTLWEVDGEDLIEKVAVVDSNVARITSGNFAGIRSSLGVSQSIDDFKLRLAS